MKYIEWIPFLLWVTCAVMAYFGVPNWGWLAFAGVVVAAGVKSFQNEPW